MASREPWEEVPPGRCGEVPLVTKASTTSSAPGTGSDTSLGSASLQSPPLVSANPGLVHQVVEVAHTASRENNMIPGGDPFLDVPVPKSFHTEEHDGYPYVPFDVRRSMRGQAFAVLIAYQRLRSRDYMQGPWMRLVANTGLDWCILEGIREQEEMIDVIVLGECDDKVEMYMYRQQVECVRMRDLLLRLLMSRMARRAERIMEGLEDMEEIGGELSSLRAVLRRDALIAGAWADSDEGWEDEEEELVSTCSEPPSLRNEWQTFDEEPQGVRATVPPTIVSREMDEGSAEAEGALGGHQGGEDVPDQAEFTLAPPWDREQGDWSASVIDAVLSGRATAAPTAPYLANVVTCREDGTRVIQQVWRESFGIQPMPPDTPPYIVSYRGQPYCFMCCKMATQEHLDSGGHSRRVRNYVDQYPSGYCQEYYRRCNALLLAGSIPVCQIQSPHPHNPTQE